MIELEDENEKYQAKINENIVMLVLLLTLLGVNNYQPLLHISKTLVYNNITQELTNILAFDYMVNPTVHVTKVFK